MPSRCVCRFARSSDARADPSAAAVLSPTGAPGLLAQVLWRASPHAQAVGQPDPRRQLPAACGSFLEGVHRPSNCARTSGRTRCPAHVPAPLCQRAARQRPLALLAFCQDAPTTHNPSRCAQMGRFSILVKINRRISSRWCVQARVQPDRSRPSALPLSLRASGVLGERRMVVAPQVAPQQPDIALRASLPKINTGPWTWSILDYVLCAGSFYFSQINLVYDGMCACGGRGVCARERPERVHLPPPRGETRLHTRIFFC